MYISFDQLRASIKELDSVHPFFGTSFLAFKQLSLDIGKPRPVDIADQESLLLEKYYNPLPSSKFYYIPLRSIGPRNRWVSKKKYPDSGLQKTRTTTFLSPFLHPNKNDWAWANDYITRLITLSRGRRVPVFHLAVWMLRDLNWHDSTKPDDIINYFLSLFNISVEEQEGLFDTTFSEHLLNIPIFQKEPVTWKNLKKIIGVPKDESPEEGGGLERLELIGVGPAKRLEIDLAQRLNIITGDNGLGKTFLLECAWWALSGHWADPLQPAYPRSDSTKPAIGFQISGNPDKPKTIYFNKASQMWPSSDENRPVLPGIVIYARVDGSCTIWDPAKHFWSSQRRQARELDATDAIRLTQDNIWYGLGENPSICNGLIKDWIDWQYILPDTAFATFSRILQKLSPQPNDMVLIPGPPTKLPFNDARMPTLRLPYDDVPIVLLSAGIKRILSMAYLLVWTWETHKEASKNIGKPPQSKIVFLIDEMEAHLHPRWQRIIVPALMDVVKELEENLEVQLIVATHSPLVLASVEPTFNEEYDSLFTLNLVDKELEIEEIQYIKFGSVNSWLTSEVFDLKRPYSVEAESALLAAKKIQLDEHPDTEKVREISYQLMEHLPAIDPFWPRWKFFAEKNGVNL